MMAQENSSLYSLTLNEMRNLFEQQGLSKFSGDQIYNWLYKKFDSSFESWSNVSKKAKEFVANNMKSQLPQIAVNLLSEDGTRKFLLEFEDQNQVEAVLIPAKDRMTLCVSSQVGCAIGCTFCNTGTMGFIRNLTADEIVGQYMALVIWCRQNVDPEFKISNVVFMGQGEPLHNFDNVKQAINILMEQKGLGLGQRKITLSTSGLAPQIEELSSFPPVNIAISLHAAHDEIRSELMPINKVYDLTRLLAAIKKIPLKRHRYITYEYLLIAGLNDREEDVIALAKLLDQKESKINIIPFNEYPESKFKAPTAEKVAWFQQRLNDRGLFCSTRMSKGRDILAACGQLKSSVDKK